jgi:hypothetical protein
MSAERRSARAADRHLKNEEAMERDVANKEGRFPKRPFVAPVPGGWETAAPRKTLSSVSSYRFSCGV